MNDAPVSTNASHLRPLDRSEALSILTEATILPLFFGPLNDRYMNSLRPVKSYNSLSFASKA